MKSLFFAIAISAISLSACNNTGNKSNNENKTATDTALTATETNKASTSTNENSNAASINVIVSSYLQLKNALANDNGKDAATAGSAMVSAFKNFDQSSLPADKKKTFEDIKDDASEHAEHIGMNGGNIKHQREHFETLSKDVYDLVKTFGANETLYKDFCPMYNNNKGATWLSETKEIKNPYLGKNMATCGEVKETIR
jgi:hypothetical protein